MTFTNIYEVENKAEALTIERREMTSWSISDKTSGSYNTVNVAYHSPRKKKVVAYDKKETEPAYKNGKADVLELRVRAENKQQAELKGNMALYKANSKQQSGSFSMEGNTLIVAGVNCVLTGIGIFSGKYYLETTTHSVDKSGGYSTDGEVKRIGLIDKNKH